MRDREISLMATRLTISTVVFMMMLQLVSATVNSLSTSSTVSVSELLRPFELIVNATVAIAPFVLALVLGLLGIQVGRRWLRAARDSPYSIWSFGKTGRPIPTEAVDLDDHDDAECLTCGRADGPGVRRGFVEEVVVAGVPLQEVDRSETFDCAAHTDREGLDALADDDEDRDPLDLALDVASRTTEDEGDSEDGAVAGHGEADYGEVPDPLARGNTETDTGGDSR